MRFDIRNCTRSPRLRSLVTAVLKPLQVTGISDECVTVLKVDYHTSAMELIPFIAYCFCFAKICMLVNIIILCVRVFLAKVNIRIHFQKR